MICKVIVYVGCPFFVQFHLSLSLCVCRFVPIFACQMNGMNVLNGLFGFEAICIQINSLLTRLWWIFMVLWLTVHCPSNWLFVHLHQEIWNELSLFFRSDRLLHVRLFFGFLDFGHFFVRKHFYIFSPNHFYSTEYCLLRWFCSKVTY